MSGEIRYLRLEDERGRFFRNIRELLLEYMILE